MSPDEQDQAELAALLAYTPDSGADMDPERVAMMEAFYAGDRDRATKAVALARDAEWRDD